MRARNFVASFVNADDRIVATVPVTCMSSEFVGVLAHGRLAKIFPYHIIVDWQCCDVTQYNADKTLKS